MPGDNASRALAGPVGSGLRELQRGNAYEAIRHLRRAEAVDPSPATRKLLGIAYYVARQYQLFVQKVNEAREASPEDFAPYYLLGRYYDSELEDFQKAAQYFRTALKLHSKHFPSSYYLGRCYEAMRDLEQAETAYRAAMQMTARAKADFALPYQGMARVRLLQGRPEQAAPFAQQAVELAPRDPEGRRILAKTYESQERLLEAVSEWERVVDLDPTDATAQYRLYRSYIVLGEKHKADSALSRFKKLSALYAR
ncbi:MAG: tetratricopeptide repeat protein [Acidobacteria bacterium]|nr:tetratricopeptide repeat protein [Acidobacteriota bacterium]